MGNTVRKNLVLVLQELYATTTTTTTPSNNRNNNNKIVNVTHWSRELHWSFPTSDRHCLNLLWYTMQKQQHRSSSKQTEKHQGRGQHTSSSSSCYSSSGQRPFFCLPDDVWLCIFSFIDRGW